MPYTIDEIKAKATPVAIHYGVDSLSLFGSYARGDADEKSDLDFLIQKGSMKGLLSYCGMIADLEDIFHCHVDLVMKNAIKDEGFLEEVSKDEVKLYDVESSELKPEVIEAMEEAKRISRDSNTKRYSSFSEALKKLDI